MTRAAVVAMAACIAAPLPAQRPAPPRMPAYVDSSYARVEVNGWRVVAPDARRAEHVARMRLDESHRIDSLRGTTLYSRRLAIFPRGVAAVGHAVIPIPDGVLLTPRVVTEKPRALPTSEFQSGAPLPQPVADRQATQGVLLDVILLGALHERAPATDAAERRTVQVDDDSGATRLTVTAERVSRRAGDTTILGRVLHRVRDSTAVRWTSRSWKPSRFTIAMGWTRQQVRGALVGTRFVDALSGRTLLLRDSLVATGTIEETDGYGDTLRGPLYLRQDREVWQRDTLWRRLMPAQPFDMVRSEAPRPVPTAAWRDSQLVRLAQAPTHGERDAIRSALRYPHDRGASERAIATSLAVGDTGAVLLMLTDQPYTDRTPLSAAQYALLRRALSSAGAAFRYGVDRELLVINLLDALLRRAPVLVQSAGVGGTPACDSAGCAAMVADARSPAPMLQALGLVAGMVSRPRVWTDSVLAHADRNPLLARGPRWFAIGAAGTATASGKVPIPAPDAPAAAWRYWMTAEDSAYVRARDADTAFRRIAASMNRGSVLRVPPDAPRAIQFAEARTGADYVGALRTARDAATAPNDRGLFDAILVALGDRVYSTAELVRILTTRGHAEQEAARRQVEREPAVAAPDSIARAIGLLVVDHVFGDSALRMPPDTPFPDGYRVPRAPDSLPRYVVMDSLPESVRARAAELGASPMPRGWQAAPGAPGFFVRFDPVRVRGPFVEVRLSHTTLFARGPGRSGGYASGFHFWLVQQDGRWTVVSASAWVT